MPGQPIKGTELRGKRTLVPGAEYAGSGQPNLANEIGQSTVEPPVNPNPDIDRDSIMLKPIDAESVTTNISGDVPYILDLRLVNRRFTTRGVVFPGGSADENQTQWEVPVPDNMDLTTPDVQVRLHILIPATDYTRSRMSGGSGARAVLSKV